MKNNPINIALFSLVIVFSSCNKISESIEQDIIVNDTIPFDIPILTSTTNSTIISGISLRINLEDEVKSGVNNFTVNQIKSTKLRSLNLALEPIENGSLDTKNNFGNLESIKFIIAADGVLGNLANATITSNGPIGGLALSPTIIPDSLRTFLMNPSKTYNVVVKAKTATTSTMRAWAAVSYSITLAK